MNVTTEKACKMTRDLMSDNRERTLGDIVSITGIPRGYAIKAVNRLETAKVLLSERVSDIKVYRMTTAKPTEGHISARKRSAEMFRTVLSDWVSMEDLEEKTALSPKAIRQRLHRMVDELEVRRLPATGELGPRRKQWKIKNAS